MWSDDFIEMTRLLVLAALLRAAYELNRRETARPVAAELMPQTTVNGNPETELTPQQRQWAEKAVKRYAEAQEKKWRRWNEAMFERSG